MSLLKARADGRADDTAALQAAIDARAAGGGGTVHVPAGKYLCGSLFLRSDITLHLEAGAVILGSEDPQRYPLIESRWEGATQKTHTPLIYGAGLHDIAVVGRGKIDGQGAAWWRRFKEESLGHPRPRLVAFEDCDNVLLDGINLVNSPSWTVNPIRCRNVVINGLTVRNPADSPNTDGINPDSCSRVRISNCLISAGDDCICLKSGTETEKAELRSPCTGIAITNCILERGHGGIAIGSEMSGGVRNVVVSDCIFNATDRGIRVKSRRGRGGVVEDIHVENVVMNDVLCPFTMNMYYACGAWGDTRVADKASRPFDAGTPVFRRVSVSRLTARGVKYAAAFLFGLAESPIQDVTLSHVSISMDANAPEGLPEMAEGLWPMCRDGLYARYTRGLVLDQVRIEGQRGQALLIKDAEGLSIS